MSEARLDITGSTAVAQRELDKATAALAKTREQVRQLNDKAKQGFDASANSVTNFAGKLTQASASTGRWSDGMKRLQQQLSLTKTDFSVLSSAMQKTVAVKDPFAPWVKGLDSLKSSQDKWSKGMRELNIQQGSAKADFSALNSVMKQAVATKDPFGPWVQGLEKLKATNDKWAAGMKVMGGQNAKNNPMSLVAEMSGKAAEGTKELLGSMGGLASQLLGVGSAAGIVVMGYEAWRQKVEEITTAHDDLSLTITKTLAEAGKLSLGPQAEKFAKEMKGATPEQATAALAGVMQSGETLSNQRTFGVAGQIAKLAPTGVDLTQTGALAADVADIAGDNVSDSDVADITVGMKQQLRGKASLFQSPKFQRQLEHLKRNGMSGEDALAHAVVALQSEQGAESLDKFATKNKSSLSVEDRKMLKSVFSAENIATAKGQISGFMRDDLAAKELEALGTFQSGREALGQQGVKEEEAKTAEQYGPVLSARRRFQKTVRERAYQSGMVSGVMTDIHQNIAGRIGDFNPAESTASEARSMRNNGTISDQEYKDLILALKENTAATRASTPARNVDSQIE